MTAPESFQSSAPQLRTRQRRAAGQVARRADDAADELHRLIHLAHTWALPVPPSVARAATMVKAWAQINARLAGTYGLNQSLQDNDSGG
jgi:hypothetical protein